MYLSSTVKRLLIGLGVWNVVAVLAYAETPLGLEEATALAKQQNRRIQQARLQTQARADEVAAARTRRLPATSTRVDVAPLLNRPSVTFPSGAFGDFPSTGPIPENDTRISVPRRVSGFSLTQVNLPLLHQRRIGMAIQTAELERQSAEKNSERTEQEVVAEVRQLYMALVAMEAAMAAAQRNSELAQELLRLAKEGNDKGTALPAELREAESRVARAQMDLTALEADRQNRREQLNQLIGRPLDDIYSLTSPAPLVSTLTLSEVRTLAASRRPEVEQARLKLRQAEVAVRSKGTELLPDVSLTFTHIGFLNSGNLAPRQIAAAGLELTWEPWDWGRRRREQDSLRRQVEQARMAVLEAEQQVQRQAGQALREWQRASMQQSASRLAVDSAAERLRVARERFQRQNALLREVLEAQTAWADAERQQAQAIADAGLAWANLELALGAKP